MNTLFQVLGNAITSGVELTLFQRNYSEEQVYKMANSSEITKEIAFAAWKLEELAFVYEADIANEVHRIVGVIEDYIGVFAKMHKDNEEARESCIKNPRIYTYKLYKDSSVEKMDEEYHAFTVEELLEIFTPQEFFYHSSGEDGVYALFYAREGKEKIEIHIGGSYPNINEVFPKIDEWEVIERLGED
ncbi:hypothetical protein [Bacillus bombysepticus]|uniref:hypothetical protein n=1 Tax=Bacillus bombysepticus TaxID=658666 RepID=UPI00301A36EB